VRIRRVLWGVAAGLAAVVLGAGDAVPAQAAGPAGRDGAGRDPATLDVTWKFIRNVYSRLNISVSGGSTANGAGFIVWPERRASNNLPAGYQAFTPQTISGSWEAWRVASTSSWYALAIGGGSSTDGAQAIQWNFEAAPTHNFEQQWLRVPYRGTNYFQLMNRNSGKCLHVDDPAQGTAVVQRSCTTYGTNQLFEQYS
jgi:hypothetical protein